MSVLVVDGRVGDTLTTVDAPVAPEEEDVDGPADPPSMNVSVTHTLPTPAPGERRWVYCRDGG